MPDIPTDPLWILFTTSLPGRSQSTPRVRLWRALKALGAATLRDGVIVLPASDTLRTRLQAIGDQVEIDGGSAWLLDLPQQHPSIEQRFRALFDRDETYADIRTRAEQLRRDVSALDEASARHQLRGLQSDLESVIAIDYFPGDTQSSTRQSLQDVEAHINRHHSPREPATTTGRIPHLDIQRYQARTWATRRKLWVDRMASAWLIRRFIDPSARIIWLERPEDCPRDALGFDFDGAAFTHVGERVTFEVLLASFGLETDDGLRRLGSLVHFLDVGGDVVAEAAGLEAILAGLRDTAPDDDALLAAAAPMLDALYQRYRSAGT